MADVRREMERFARQQLSRNREAPLERFILRSAQVGTRGQEVDTFPIPAEITGDNIGIFIDEILTKAQADADAAGGKLVRFMLVACEQGKKDGPRYSFRLRGEGEEDGDGEEPPTERGLVSQLMRHNEALARTLTMTVGQTNMILAKRLEQAERANEVLLTQRHAYLDSLEQAKSLQHERDMQMLLTSGEEERKATMMKKLEMLLPLVVNKITGRSALPEGAHSNIFEQLASSLQPEQLQQIAQFLTMEQQMLFLTLLKAAREKSQPSS